RMLIMSTSSIYYAATDVPVKHEEKNASEAFSSLKKNVSVSAMVCFGMQFVGLICVFFSLHENEVAQEHKFKLLFCIAYVLVLLACALSFFMLCIHLFNLIERLYYNMRFDGKVYFVESIKVDDHCWIQFLSPSGDRVRLYMAKGEDEICYALDLLRYDKQTRSSVNMFLASPLPEQKIDTEKLIDSKYMYSKEYINTRREMP
ncbi:MAG: hypothetical protein Q4A26_01450, partial [Candidatus Saccharibacteria bacterium]|nr:hypothetical protein [Candidatus Saccharibacteria bacterium]